jgi:glycosyltransferase involved in cell wall biosynthesis
MKLSLVTSSFNSGATIRETLDSVRAQSHLPFEYIVIDGGSTDETLEILEEYSDVITKVVSESDDGIYDALNKGIAWSTGDIVGLLHSDDLFANLDVLGNVMRTFEETSADAVYGDLDYVEREDIRKITRKWRSRNFEKNLFYNGWMPAHPTFYLRREHYETYGGYRTDMRISADYELMLRMLLKHGHKAVYIPEVLVKMREGGESNASLKNRLKANREDRMAWRVNDIKPRFFTSILKPLSKLKQFFS